METGKLISLIATGTIVAAGIGVLCNTDKGKKSFIKMKEGNNEYLDKVKGSVVNFLFGIIDRLTSTESNKRTVEN